jgi:hypothetical protein
MYCHGFIKGNLAYAAPEDGIIMPKHVAVQIYMTNFYSMRILLVK